MMRARPQGADLVTVRSSRGVQLHGILYRQVGRDTTIIHVHGSFGNFYANPITPVMARIYGSVGLNFLSRNVSAHDGVAEGDRSGVIEYVGDHGMSSRSAPLRLRGCCGVCEDV